MQQRAHLAVLKESEEILLAALQGSEMPDDLLKLGETMGWTETQDTDSRSNELQMFYLTLRSGILVEEARLVWVEEVLPILRNKT